MKILRVGFIGLGLMGNPMAKNILKSGFTLTVFNRTVAKTEELRVLGARLALTPADVARESDVVITMVTAPADVEHVLFGTGGVIEGSHPGMTVVDMETIGPTAARTIGHKLSLHSVSFLDAPVTGSTPKAKTGELTIFVGGADADFNRVKPILLAMGKTIHHMGGIGSGQAIKLINNYLIAATIGSLAEAMVLADVVGLSGSRVAEVLETVPAMSEMMKLKLPNFVNGRYPLLFTMNNMNKDIQLGGNELRNSRKTMPLFSTVLKAYEKAVSAGFGEADYSEVIKVLGKDRHS